MGYDGSGVGDCYIWKQSATSICTVKVDKTGSFETLVAIYQTAGGRIAEDTNFHGFLSL
jgi:hypothetical protein